MDTCTFALNSWLIEVGSSCQLAQIGQLRTHSNQS